MSTFEHDILIREVDEKGDMHINYPVTKSKNIKIDKDTNLDDVMKKLAYIYPSQTLPEDPTETIMYNADLLEGKPSKYFENYADNTKNRTWVGNTIAQEYGGTGLSKFTPNTILYVDSTNKINLLEAPSSDCILAFLDGEYQWVDTINLILDTEVEEETE